MNSTGKKLLIGIVGLAALVIIFGLGVMLGQSQGRNAVLNSLSPTIKAIYPAPPAVIKSLTGKITNIAGATLSLQVPDPNDYLPHADNSPQATQIRYAVVNQNTVIKSINYQKMDSHGLPQVTILKLTDLKTDETVTVQSNTNIKDAQQFDATEIDLLQS